MDERTTREAAIAAAFRKLKVPAGERGKLYYKETIPSIARELALMAGGGPLRHHDEHASHLATVKELADLKKRAEGLLDAIDALHRPAIDALNYRDGVLIGTAGVTTQLRILIASASCAEIPDQPSSRGAKVKVQPRRIALAVAAHYHRLTGDRPTVDTRQIDTDYDKGSESYGPFLDLLTEVFAALGVKASPESQAKIASGAFKAKYR
jgi:hypothetical protein